MVVSLGQSGHSRRPLETRFGGGTGPWELYDLAADRSETNDLAAEQPQRVEQWSAPGKSIWKSCRELAGRDDRT